MVSISKKRPSASKQLTANVIGRAWVLLSNVVFVPVYLNLLGIQNFGVVALFIAVIGLIAFLDMGLSPTLARELNDQKHTHAEKLDLLHTYEIIYATLVCVIVAVALLLPTEAYQLFVSAEDIARPEVAESIHLVFAAAAVLMLFNFYIAGILGIEQHVKGNIVLLSAGVIRSALVIAPLRFYPTPYVFLIWQLVTALAFTFIARILLYRLIGASENDRPPAFNRTLLIRNVAFSGSLFLVSIAAAVNTQIDKIFIGKLSGLEALASYSLVSTFSQILVFAVTPITITLLPRLVRIVTSGDDEGVRNLFGLAYRFVAAIVTTGVGSMIWFGPYLISLWTSGKLSPVAVSDYSTPLILGYGLLALSMVPHNVAVAYKNMRGSMLISLSVFVTIPSFSIFIGLFGLQGAAGTWLALQAVTAPFYLFWVDRTLLHLGGVFRMLVSTVIIPFSVAMAVCYAAYQLLGEASELGRNLSVIALAVAITFLCNLLLTLRPSDRVYLLQAIAR